MKSKKNANLSKVRFKIYTKTGDEGETGLFSGTRVKKDHLRIQILGQIDELNARLGVVLQLKKIPKPMRISLTEIQSELFQLGAEIANPGRAERRIGPELTLKLEKQIDQMDDKMPALRNFILPGGSDEAAHLHLARSAARQTERTLITLHHAEAVNPEILKFINRLSDFLFVCARFANWAQKKKDVPWISKPAL